MESQEEADEFNSSPELVSDLPAILNNVDLQTEEDSSTELQNRNVEEITYDMTIAAKHEYFGTDLEEIGGRTLHDEGSVVWLPILKELEVILVPGQTLPLTAFAPSSIAMFRKIISKDKTFGVVCVNSSAQYGTTAEIYQYQEGSGLAGFKIKARGRQRFKLLEQKRIMPGVLSGRVLILPEITLLHPLQSSRFFSLNKYRCNLSKKSKISSFDASCTFWPSWVYKQYDTNILAKNVIQQLKSLQIEVNNSVSPVNPLDLSYWVAQSLPIDGVDKIKFLGYDTSIERLHYALNLITKCQKLYCIECGRPIADRRDVFAVSNSGQGMYCNPGGFVHDIITVYNGIGMSLINSIPSVEYSWFPGYGWKIAQCSNCNSHIGWLFVAMNSSLRPEQFWGLSRRSVTTHQKDVTRLV